MIIVEERVRELVAQMPEIRLNNEITRSPSFHWGDGVELNKYLEITDEKHLYPLIWLLLGSDSHVERGNLCTRNCEFIIATRETQKDMLNDARFERAFKVVLNPVLDYLLQGLDNSSISRIEGESWSVERRPNFTENGDNFTIDKWDAIKLTVEVEFNNHCLNKITWQTI